MSVCRAAERNMFIYSLGPLPELRKEVALRSWLEVLRRAFLIRNV